MRLKIVFLVLVTACGSGGSEPEPDPPSPPAPSEYTLAYEGPTGVELTNATGTVHRTLVPDAVPLGWSPDGHLLALVKRQHSESLWVINPDSGGLRQLTGFVRSVVFDSDIWSAKWAPSGRELLYEVSGGTVHSPLMLLYRVTLDGNSTGPLRSYTSSPYSLSAQWMDMGLAADWSPDGGQIVVHQPSAEGPEVYISNRDETARRFVAKGQQPDWSPDGSTIVFVAGPSSCECFGQAGLRVASSSLHVIDADGSQERQLTHPAEHETDEHPAWSPDGSKVAFVRLGFGPDSVVTSVAAYLVDANGTNEHQIAVLPAHEESAIFRPSWSADGQHLAFTGYSGIYVVEADGSASHTVTDTDIARYVPSSWRP